MPDHFIEVYTSQAAAYHRMITAEDVDGNLLPALQRVAPLDGRRVLDLGSGTGRLPLMLHGLAAQVVALDRYHPMLVEQAKQRGLLGGDWPLVQADMRALPFPSGHFDLVTAGWALGHFTGWYPQDWKAQMGKVLEEMERVLVPGGALVILETLGTGTLTPTPPTADLAEYYTWLEDQWVFTRQEVRSDYQFASLDEAVAYTEFFFGAELAAKIRDNGWVRLPEWTGIWGKQIEGRIARR